MVPIEKGQSLILNNLFFETGKAVIKKESNAELNRIVKILKRVLPKLIANPSILIGHDVSYEEAENIMETKSLSLELLEHPAGDNFFELYSDRFGITEEEAGEMSRFLQKTAKHYLKELQRKFPFIKE